MNRLFLLLGLVLLAFQAQAQSIVAIELENRPAAEVIPIIQPMLRPGDAISGEGFKIFLRASPDTRASVQDMVEYLDVALKTLEVSVFQGSARDLRRLAGRASVQIDSGNVQVDVGDERAADAAGSARFSTAGGSASVGGSSTQGSLSDTPVHRVRVTEGTEAYIETGQQIPYFFNTAVFGVRGYAAGVEYRDAVTGFYVLPRVRGENVVLDVSPYKSSRINSSRDDVATVSASTTVTGRIGEWLMIGAVTEQITRTDNSTGNTIRTEGGRDSGIWIRADLVQ
jgi:type II secretory pathway component GspD/PulD (secretin)